MRTLTALIGATPALLLLLLASASGETLPGAPVSEADLLQLRGGACTKYKQQSCPGGCATGSYWYGDTSGTGCDPSGSIKCGASCCGVDYQINTCAE